MDAGQRPGAPGAERAQAEQLASQISKLGPAEAADALESMVPQDVWPLPTYREMLFIK